MSAIPREDRLRIDAQGARSAADYWSPEDKVARLAVEYSDALVEALSTAPGLAPLRQGITAVLLAFLGEASGQGEGLERREVRVVRWPAA